MPHESNECLQLMLLSEERPANLFRSTGQELESLTLVATSRRPFSRFLAGAGLGGSSGRTSRISSALTAGTPSPKSLGPFLTSGIGVRGKFWTCEDSEFPRGEEDCSWSGILETGVIPQPYYFTAYQAGRIVERIEKHRLSAGPVMRHLKERLAAYRLSAVLREGKASASLTTGSYEGSPQGNGSV